MQYATEWYHTVQAEIQNAFPIFVLETVQVGKKEDLNINLYLKMSCERTNKFS